MTSQEDPKGQKKRKSKPQSRKYETWATPLYVARVWEEVERMAGFAVGDATRQALRERIDVLHQMGLLSDQTGAIIFHEWQEHRKWSRYGRDLREMLVSKGVTPPPAPRAEKRRYNSSSAKPSVTIVRKDQPTEAEVDDTEFDEPYPSGKGEK